MARIKSGIYPYSLIRGSKVEFIKFPINMLCELRSINKTEFTVRDIYCKITALGNFCMLVELEELPGKLFSPKILVSNGVKDYCKNTKSLCGRFLCGQALVGKGVDKTSNGGIKFVDNEGNVLEGDRYIHFNNSRIDNIDDDLSVITVNTNGGKF
jgi:hypothetical protein